MSEVPVGRRIAQWRVRRNMTQQQFADRIGKSKSWVDKVERGERRVERVSNLREVADALRIDLASLLPDRAGRSAPAAAGVERVRAALAKYHVPASSRPVDVEQVRARLDHAEQSYRHARYPALLRLLPDLLDTVRQVRVDPPDPVGDELLVGAYGLVALALIKVDQRESAWLAADRGMAVALGAGNALLAAATVPLSQALRAVGRRRSAMDAAVVAAQRIARGAGDAATLRTTLLVQAGLAAGGRGDGRSARELIDQAAAIVPELPDGYGTAAVEAARVVIAADLGDVGVAAARHERLTAGNGWRWLPTEHRAAYLLDVARAHARLGDMLQAGRALLDAERTAPGEVRERPSARALVAVVARAATAPAALTRLATSLHVGGDGAG
ncbi:helix-turn-helix domain-containing protein [Micromonospora sp. NPDC049900]|uniref:helix-turn-helix domain-containing protein n=1 Tax=Micromonospora sp. NPDC049900 TaxID=3364275 RepID=UPI003792BB1A